MRESTRQKCIAYGVSAAVAIVVTVAVSLRQGFSFSQPFRENCRDLCDGFFVAGMMMTGIGVLTLIASTGFFDIFAYGMVTLLSHFIPRMGGGQKYYDYKMAREEGRKRPLRNMLYVGLVCIGLSLLFLWLYYC